MFVTDRDRVKSFTWDKESGRPVHTLNSNEDTSWAPRAPPNGHIIRAGEGSALCWWAPDPWARAEVQTYWSRQVQLGNLLA